MAGYNYMNRGYTEGGKRPIISYTPNHHDSESYVTSTETIVEHTPVVVTTEYQYSTTATKVEPLKDYGVPTTNKWRRPSSPVLDRPQVMVTEYGYSSPTEVEPRNNYGVTNDKWRRPLSPVHDRPQVGLRDSSPTKVQPVKDYYGVSNDKWRRPSSPVHEYGYNSPKEVEPMDYRVTNDKWHRPSSLVQDRPQKVEEFITSIQTEVGRPTRSGLLSAPNWRNNTPNSKIGQVCNIGYDDYTNYNDNNDWNKPTIRDESLADPFIANRDARERPSRNGTWLSGPTNDIGKAVEILREAVKPLSVTGTAQPIPTPQPRMTVPVSTIPKSDTYTETIDSREAQSLRSS